MKKLIVALFVSLISIAASAQNSKVIVQLTNPLKDSFWFPLTDQIRFGEKGSTAFMSVDWEKATGSFFGELKINDGAGFASYRNIDKVDLSDYNTLEIPVKGDGRKYKVILKDQQAIQSLVDYSYQAEFTTSNNELKQIGLNLEDFKPVYRGKIDNSLPELNKAQIEEMGLQINDKIPGAYSLEFGEWTATK